MIVFVLILFYELTFLTTKIVWCNNGKFYDLAIKLTKLKHTIFLDQIEILDFFRTKLVIYSFYYKISNICF